MIKKDAGITGFAEKMYVNWNIKKLLTASSALSRVPSDFFDKPAEQNGQAEMFRLLTKTMHALTEVHANVAVSFGQDARRPAWIEKTNLDELMPVKVLTQCVTWLCDFEQKQNTEYRHMADKIQQLAAYAMAIMLLIKQEYFQMTEHGRQLFSKLFENASPVTIAAIAKQVADLAPNSPAIFERAALGGLLTDLTLSENKLSAGITPAPESYRGRRIAHRMLDTRLPRRLMTSDNIPLVVRTLDALAEIYSDDEPRNRLLNDSSPEGNLAQISWLIRQKQFRTHPDAAFAQQALCRAVIKGVELDDGTHADVYLSLWNSFVTEGEKEEVFRQEYPKLLDYLLSHLPIVRSVDDVRLFFTHQCDFKKSKPLLLMSGEVLNYCITRFHSVASGAYRPYASEIVKQILSDAELSAMHLPSLQRLNPVVLYQVLLGSELGRDVPSTVLPDLARHLAAGERFDEEMRRHHLESDEIIARLGEMLKNFSATGNFAAISIIWLGLRAILGQSEDGADV